MSRAAADTWFEPRQDAFEAKLEARFNMLGEIRWPQVLLTHTDANIPADGGGVVPDALDRVTTDNGDGWGTLNFTIGGPWKAALEVNNYGGPLGQGYELVMYVGEGGALYRKVPKVEGPETWREHDWREMLQAAPEETLLASMWSATKRGAATTWRVLNTPIGDLWRA